jgi:hypothetical protein
MKTGASLRFEPGSFQEAIYDCYIGVAVGARHDLWFLSKWLMNALQLVGLKAPQDDVPPPTEKGELRVVGIGFGRTGTVRYMAALVLHCRQSILPKVFALIHLARHTITWHRGSVRRHVWRFQIRMRRSF